MDSIDIADIAFSLAAAADLSPSPANKVINNVVNDVNNIVNDVNNIVNDVVNEVTSSIPEINNVVSNIVDDTNSGINIYLIIGFLILIGGFLLYNYFINRAKKVTFNENVENYYNGNS
jgi:phage-related protein